MAHIDKSKGCIPVVASVLSAVCASCTKSRAFCLLLSSHSCNSLSCLGIMTLLKQVLGLFQLSSNGAVSKSWLDSVDCPDNQTAEMPDNVAQRAKVDAADHRR